MSESTQRWPVRPRLAPAPATPPPPESLSPTRVSDRVSVRPPVDAPVVFPGFEVLSELGRGGMGVVYKARQRNLNRLVALKVILGGPLASVEDKARFRVEAEAAARLHHPNIVQVYDVGEHAGFSYIALELVEGETLRQWQAEQAVEPQVAARLVSAVARAIQHAHEQGIVHRDLKPANILLSPLPVANSKVLSSVSTSRPVSLATETVSRLPAASNSVPLTVMPKVTDFGLAKTLEGGSDLTITGVACGTPNYMAPEQVRGQALSPGVDVYGLGAVLYELLAGRPPFAGADPAEAMNLILNTEPPGVRKFAPGVPRDLAVIVAKCLEKNPGRRYLTARDAADDLDRFLAGKPIAARPVGRTERAWRWVKRNPVAASFLFISSVGCTLTGGMALALARSESDQRVARATAESARAEAEQQRHDAENARDELRAALTAAELARHRAEGEEQNAAAAKAMADSAREDAKQEAQRAVAKQQEADTARARAEANLRVARGVIRVSLRELSGHPRFEDDDFRTARQTLIEQVRPFRDAVAQHAPNTPEWLDDIADVSHWLGFLEFLNGNQNAAAAEYRTAATAAGRWAQLEPHKSEPRVRQAHSLVNAGNALFNARRFGEAETCYRDAAKLFDGVVRELPTTPFYRRHAVEAYGQLANVLRTTNQLAECEVVARGELNQAQELVRVCGEAVENLRALAVAQLSLARALARQQKWDEADCHFSDAVATRERIRDVIPTVPRHAFEYASALLAQANFLNGRGHHDRAADAFGLAANAFEKFRAAAPYSNAQGVEMAAGWTQYAEFLRGRKHFVEAERRYNQALEATALVSRRAPTFRPAREASWAAAVGRAHLFNATARHREAAAEWKRLASEDPDPRVRARHELFAIQSLLFAADWNAAVAAADAQMKREQPGWMWTELGRVWCLAVRRIEADTALAPADRLREKEAAVTKAVACLEKAKAAGEFAGPDKLLWFTGNADFEPVREKFDPAKK